MKKPLPSIKCTQRVHLTKKINGDFNEKNESVKHLFENDRFFCGSRVDVFSNVTQ
jgi:hypothetical protein